MPATIGGSAGAGPVSVVGALAHAASTGTTERSSKRRMAGKVVAGGRGEGVLFTTQRRSGPAPTLARGHRPAARQRHPRRGEHNLAKPNFGYQKRQKELEKKRKKEEKLKKRQERAATPPAEGAPPAPEPGEAV